MKPLGTGMVTLGVIILLNALMMPATVGINNMTLALWIVGAVLLVGGIAVRRQGPPTAKEELRGRQLAELRVRQAGSVSGFEPEVRSTKRCPDCAEEIQAAARKCRFCGSELGEQVPAAALPP